MQFPHPSESRSCQSSPPYPIQSPIHKVLTINIWESKRRKERKNRTDNTPSNQLPLLPLLAWWILHRSFLRNLHLCNPILRYHFKSNQIWPLKRRERRRKVTGRSSDGWKTQNLISLILQSKDLERQAMTHSSPQQADDSILPRPTI